MKPTEPITHVSQWMKKFNSSSLYRHEPSRLFEDWLDLVLCCVSNQQQEAKYLKIAAGYTREELNTHAELFAMLILIHEHQTSGVRRWYDMLGDIYMEMASRSKTSRLGQFFTPDAVCELSARMTMGDAPQEGASICDPAAGSGRMLLAAHALQPKLGLVVACDIDPICAKMCALNFWLHGIRGEVACMDSLGLKWYWSYQTHPRHTWPFVTFLDESRKADSLMAMQCERKEPIAAKPAPIDLFNQVQDPAEEYHKLKLQYPDCVLMFHVPGSYLFLNADVRTAADIIGVTCESDALRIPESWLEDVLPALTQAGHKVAVCEDDPVVSDPMTQYRKIKPQYRDALLILRDHQGYLMLYRDAERAANVLAIDYSGNGPMRIAKSMLENVLDRLVAGGHRVAVVIDPNVDDPRAAKQTDLWDLIYQNNEA